MRSMCRKLVQWAIIYNTVSILDYYGFIQAPISASKLFMAYIGIVSSIHKPKAADHPSARQRQKVEILYHINAAPKELRQGPGH